MVATVGGLVASSRLTVVGGGSLVVDGLRLVFGGGVTPSCASLFEVRSLTKYTTLPYQTFYSRSRVRSPTVRSISRGCSAGTTASNPQPRVQVQVRVAVAVPTVPIALLATAAAAAMGPATAESQRIRRSRAATGPTPTPSTRMATVGQAERTDGLMTRRRLRSSSTCRTIRCGSCAVSCGGSHEAEVGITLGAYG